MNNTTTTYGESDFYKDYKAFLKIQDSKEREAFLKNDSFIRGAIKYLEKTDLSFFFFLNNKNFNQYLLEDVELMKPLCLKVFNAIQESKLKDDLNAMLRIVNQPGIHPMIICYVNPKIQNNMEFIATILVNTNSIDDFYENSIASFEGSNMRYGPSIGKDIQTNPFFWEMLNSLMKRKNPNAKLFDVKKEVEIAKKHFAKEEEQKEKIGFESLEIRNDEGPIIIELGKGKYFDTEDTYYIRYSYSSIEQAERMKRIYSEQLIPSVGSKSPRFIKEDFIRPYLIDRNGEFVIPNSTGSNAVGIGGTNIPEDLLVEFIKRMVELDKCIIKCGTLTMSAKFDPDKLEEMKAYLNKKGLKK